MTNLLSFQHDFLLICRFKRCFLAFDRSSGIETMIIENTRCFFFNMSLNLFSFPFHEIGHRAGSHFLPFFPPQSSIEFLSTFPVWLITGIEEDELPKTHRFVMLSRSDFWKNISFRAKYFFRSFVYFKRVYS